MDKGGALEAFIEARKQGLARFLGVTGHGLEVAAMHLRSLERFDFDSVLLPYSYTMMENAVYAADFARLFALCRERDVAVQTIKSLVRAPWGDKPQTRATWYEPLENQADIDLVVHWVMGEPELFLNTVGDIHVLPKVLDAASRYSVRPSDEQMTRLSMERDLRPLFV
jgi:aryl-alcohol dehydrogenase-like predicted oxidoreductase